MLRLFNSPRPSILRGGLFFCFIFLHNRHMNILQRIFTDYYEEIKYTLHHRASEMENIEKMINCGDPSFGGAMYGCHTVEILSPFLFATTAVYVPLAVTSIPWNVLHLLNWQPSICHARLPAGCFQFTRTPTTVFPIK